MSGCACHLPQAIVDEYNMECAGLEGDGECSYQPGSGGSGGVDEVG